jgi:hypothetical protein
MNPNLLNYLTGGIFGSRETGRRRGAMLALPQIFEGQEGNLIRGQDPTMGGAIPMNPVEVVGIRGGMGNQNIRRTGPSLLSTVGRVGANILGRAGGVLGGAGKALGAFAGANPALAAGGLFGLLGLGMGVANRPKDIDQDFTFDMERSQYNPNSALQQNMGSLRGLGGTFQQQATDMLNPGSTYNQRQFQMLRRNIGDQSSQSINNMNAAMASRGMMGIGGAYDAIANRQAGDQFAQGQQGIINQGTQLAGQMGNLAMGAYGQAGQLAAGIDTRTLQNQQFNAQNANTYNQYLKMAEYNQAVQNQNAQASYRNNMSQGLFNLGGMFGLGRRA